MKFPLATPPFAPIELDQEQRDSYEQLASSLLHETIGEYDDFVDTQHRTIDKRRWKAVKKRENVTVYKQREFAPDRFKSYSNASTTSTSGTSTTSVAGASHWSLPKMLAVGTIVGNLDDVIYGIISPDVDSIKVKTTYVQDELIDGRVLSQIQYPTEHDPFRFLALKWFVKAHPASVNAVVWPRDIVFIEGTGVHELSNGDRLGYHLLHSVELPECAPLTHLGIMRCQFSSCFLFRQLENGTTEVYMKSHVEPGGNLPDVVAVMSTANGLIGCWKSVWCAQNRKLTWMLREAAAARARETPNQPRKLIVSTNADGKQCCGNCARKLPSFRSLITCEVCRTVMCSRCRTARKLTFVRKNGDVAQIATVFCKNCITNATRMNAADVARCEYVPGAAHQRPRLLRTHSESVHPVRSRRGSAPIDGAESKATPSSTSSSSSSRSSIVSQQDHHFRRHRSARAPAHGTTGGGSVAPIVLLEDPIDGGDDFAVETIDEWEHRYQGQRSVTDDEDEHSDLAIVPRSVGRRGLAAGAPPMHAQAARAQASASPQQPLWMQMNQLWVTAEKTYQMTKQHAGAFKAPRSP